MRFPAKEEVEAIRSRYPIGMRVELVNTTDPWTKLKPGDRGTVKSIDDTGTVFISWDRGSSLGMVLSEDVIRPVAEMDFYIGQDCASGAYFKTKEAFLSFLSEAIDEAQEAGKEHFDITILE